MPGQSARRRRPGIPKVVLDSQRIVSLEAARRLNDSHPEIAAHWRERSETYGRLVHQTRDVGGPYGNGGLAAGQGSVSVARIQRLPADGLSDAGQLQRLELISTGIDQRVRSAVELGIREHLYFQRVVVPAIENDNGDLVRGPRREWVPVTGPVQNRREFGAALNHRPGNTGPSLST